MQRPNLAMHSRRVAVRRREDVCLRRRPCGRLWRVETHTRITAMVEVTVKLPDKLAQSFGDTPDLRSRHLLENAVIEEYRAGRISHGQVGETLGLDYWQTESFLVERKVPLNYSLEDLELDRATLDKVLDRP